MIGMNRDVPSNEAPHSPLLIEMVMGMLGDEPIDPGLIARVQAPELAAAREKADAQLRASDWPNLGRYQADNLAIIQAGTRPDVVFMGDSMTELWTVADPGFFTGGRVSRGISGQTSPQMLLRFHADVIALQPRAVHLLCGGNDIAGNTGPTTPYRYQCNVRAMVDLALAHGLKVYLGSITPAAQFLWQPGIDPRPWIAELNVWLKALATERGLSFIDYHGALQDDTAAMQAAFTHDHVHANRRGYIVMRKAFESKL